MIAVRLMGGLGNMMFQIAAMETLARNEVYYDYQSNLRTQAGEGRVHAYRYNEIFAHFRMDVYAGRHFYSERELHIPFEYSPLQFVDGSTYIGYFQSEQYFDPVLVRQLFAWSAAVETEADQWCLANGFTQGLADACAVHVRRGDYLHHPGTHPVQTPAYYQEGLRLLHPRQVLVFSDDPAWCRAHLQFGMEFTLVDAPDYLAMALMSRCGSAVISNSSFSWWGAWLANGPTVAPHNWFGPDGPSARDIVPARWIKR